jgi:hypothetical protein
MNMPAMIVAISLKPWSLEAKLLTALSVKAAILKSLCQLAHSSQILLTPQSLPKALHLRQPAAVAPQLPVDLAVVDNNQQLIQRTFL